MDASPSVGEPYQLSTVPRWIIGAFVVLFVLVGYLLYESYTTGTVFEAGLSKANDQAKLLSALVDQTNGRLADMKGQLDVAAQKLGLTQAELARARSLAQRIRKERKASDERLTAQIGQVRQESEAKIGQVSSELGGAKSDIESTKKDLEAAKGRLEGAIGDLGVHSGLIARNREELEELKRLGERNIFEFTLQRSKKPSRVGPIQLALTKVNTKSYRYTMTVFANDRSIQKRNKTVNEPVQFYVKRSRTPYEIVVFEVSKNRAVGYLSTPKEGGA